MRIAEMERQPETIVQVEKVTFAYNSVLALKDIDLTIRRGDFLAIIGPNGSGKTTLLKIMVGLLKPQAGRVWLFDQLLENFNDWHRIGYIQQKATNFDSLFPASVEEVIASSLRSSEKLKKSNFKPLKERIREVLRLMGLEEEIKRPITELSGGQQQRVLLARALVLEPEILFLDEPTTGVDYFTQDNFYELLGQLNREKSLTIVLVTHDYGIVNKNVNRVACLNQSLIYHGEHSEFCQSAVVQEFLRGGHHLVSHRH